MPYNGPKFTGPPLREAGKAEPCETCGTPVRWARYDGGRRVFEVVNGRDLPGGHTPERCRAARAARTGEKP